MKGKTLLGLAFATASSLAAGPLGTVPKAAANRYAVHAEKDGVSIGAALLTSHDHPEGEELSIENADPDN